LGNFCRTENFLDKISRYQLLTLVNFNVILFLMPRAKVESGEPVIKKATTSRATKRVSTTGATNTPAATTRTRRKAPTVITQTNKKHSPKTIALMIGVFLLIAGGSAVLGMTDGGQINVAGVIEERGQTLREEGKNDEANLLTVPKNDGTRAVNGGLRPQGANSNPEPEPEAPPPATLGAATTTENATSTDIAPAIEEPVATTTPEVVPETNTPEIPATEATTPAQ
jgi:hypothetical protein